MALQSYRGLTVWQTAIDLVESVYLLTKDLPAAEKYGLSSQLQRAAVSVPANIAEGYGRLHRGDYLHHLSIAQGSLMELETHLVIVIRLQLVTQEQAAASWELTQQVGRLLTRLIASLRPQTPAPKPQPQGVVI